MYAVPVGALLIRPNHNCIKSSVFLFAELGQRRTLPLEGRIEYMSCQTPPTALTLTKPRRRDRQTDGRKDTRPLLYACCYRELKCVENYKLNDTIIYKTASSSLAISDRNSFRVLFNKIASVCFIRKKHINILALEMASPGNRHCANCIGTLSSRVGVGSMTMPG